ncbi:MULTISPECIES: hypothetical protein [Bacillati]|uniref:Uncharacterized protein n=1 Tax=Streptomyces virens TaxID=285572 RepID=A0ABN3V374_9ACTN
MSLNPKRLRPMPFARLNEAQSVHNRMVRSTAEQLVREGFEVFADHIGWSGGTPIEVDGYRPDIIAIKNRQMYLLEVETMDSYNKEHCISQISAFSKALPETHVILPAGYMSTQYAIPYLKYTMAKRNISAHIGTCNLLTRHTDFRL